MRDFLLVAGARPNFMKIAPLIKALKHRGASVFLVHTGQHYDPALSDVFFRELEIPDPDLHLGIGSGERHEQTRKIVDALQPVLRERKPHAVIVVGDVTSTAAAAMAGVAAGTPVVHVEAGLRSYNWTMPEELNRMIADHHSILLFSPDEIGRENVLKEGIPEHRVHVVGNIMIDTLHTAMHREDDAPLERFDVRPNAYAVLTMHRGENVDDPATLAQLWSMIADAAALIPIIFPMHPRTKARVEAAGLKTPPNVTVTEPLGYFDQITLMKRSMCVLTDSGGIQEETTVLGIPCLTLRQETERPATVEFGTNEIIGHDRDKLMVALNRVLRGEWKRGRIPELWDGKAAERIADILLRHEF